MTDDELDDRIEAWHQSGGDVPLHTWLAWTEAQCAAWVETGKQPEMEKQL